MMTEALLRFLQEELWISAEFVNVCFLIICLISVRMLMIVSLKSERWKKSVYEKHYILF